MGYIGIITGYIGYIGNITIIFGYITGCLEDLLGMTNYPVM